MSKRSIFFTNLPSDTAAIEVITEIIDTAGKNGNIEHEWTVRGADGKQVGTAYQIDKFMVDYVHEAVAVGGIAKMLPEFVGNTPIGV